MAKNLIKEYLDSRERTYQDGGEIKDKESRKERKGKGHMELYADNFELTGDALDYYNTSIQRMKELYENDTNHPYQKIMFNEKGKYIKERKQESDAEQGLSFEDWLKTNTGQYYNYSALENSYYVDRKDLSATKTRRRGKQKTITRTTDPKDKENYIQYIMNSDDPTRDLYSSYDFYRNEPKPKYSGDPYKLFRWIRKAEKGNPKFKINE